MKKLTIYSSIFAVLTTVGTAYALNNEGVAVKRVEALEKDRVFIHIKGKIKSMPKCAKHDNIIACSLKDEFCRQSFKVALGARMSDSEIDFEVENRCIGNVTEFSRLRF
jgi:hypothetical protein